jgi:hypothetical protein
LLAACTHIDPSANPADGIELQLSFDRDPSIAAAFQLLSLQLGLTMHRLHLRLHARERGDTLMRDSEVS